MTRMQPESSPLTAVERLREAINRHDLDAMAACFASDYDSTFPAHPDRAFKGVDQVRKNWWCIFSDVPDLKAELLRSAVDGDTVWAEWEWKGTHRAGMPFHQRGVTIQGIRQGWLAWARLYMEPVREGSGADAAIREQFGGRG